MRNICLVENGVINEGFERKKKKYPIINVYLSRLIDQQQQSNSRDSYKEWVRLNETQSDQRVAVQ